jgi:hypothetical protein
LRHIATSSALDLRLFARVRAFTTAASLALGMEQRRLSSVYVGFTPGALLNDADKTTLRSINGALRSVSASVVACSPKTTPARLLRR